MNKEYEIPKEYLGGKRKDHLTLDETFMATALLWAGRSKDPSTQVGACFVNEENRIISIGYNGSPNGWDDDNFPWERDMSIGEENTKYPYVIHAEINGILNYGGSLKDFNNSTVYVTLFPCRDCAKFLAQKGIKRVVYLSDKYIGTKDNISAKIIFKKCGVEYVSFDELNKRKTESINILLKENESIKVLKKN